MEEAIRIENLRKSYGDVLAVDSISFCVKKGELFAFLGENGAGKSTTISVLCGETKKDSGRVLIDGIADSDQNEETRARLGVVFQSSCLDKPLSARENLRCRAALYGIVGKAFDERLDEIARMLDLAEFLDRPIGKLSGGQRRRVDIARALFHRPTILILDEPTTGLDPQTRKSLWETIATLQREEALTVLLTTHYMEEAAEADHIVILEKGRIVEEGTPLELKNRNVNDSLTLYGVSAEEASVLGKPITPIANGVRVSVASPAEARELIGRYPALFEDFEFTKGKMDDVFLAVTGKALGKEEK